MSKGPFIEVKCAECGGPVQGLQLTAQQRQWLDVTKEAVLDHMRAIYEAKKAGISEEEAVQAEGWLAIAEPFLFLYGYMTSREDKRQ
jgi:hypothetical protein